MDLIADTSYLVGLWRGQGWATQHASVNSSKSLGMCWVVLGEFWHGARRAGHDEQEVREFLDLGVPLVDALPVVDTYAQICAELSRDRSYMDIGQNDLWIAAVALKWDKPLVTRNKRHFGLISGLRLEVLSK